MTMPTAVGVALRYVMSMPKRSSKNHDPGVPAGIGLHAAMHITEASSDDGKDPAAVALGRKGGLKGGKARASKMTASQRSDQPNAQLKRDGGRARHGQYTAGL